MPTHFTEAQARDVAVKIGIDWTSAPFDVEQFRAGMDVELEHGKRDPETNVTDDDPLVTGKIALAHLRELPDYYTRLAAMESEDETVVLYKTKYGSTRQYAEWIGEALKTDVLPLENASDDVLRRCKTVIIGGSVRMGMITCADFLKRRWNILHSKHIVLFSVSATDPADPEIRTYYAKSVPDHMRAAIRYFPLPGRVGTLDWTDRLLMTFPRHMLRRQLRLDPANEELRKKYEEMTKPFDHTARTAIDPLLQYCASI